MTTTDIATRDQGGALAVASDVQSLVSRYAEDLRHCMSLAEGIVDTEIVPPSFWPAPAIVIGDEVKILKSWEWDPRRKHPKESPEDYAGRRRAAMATTGGVIHVGATLGHVSYFQSISGIYFVGGRPALMSEEMRAQVLGHGHYIRVVERTRTVAAVECKRRGESGDPRRYVFTIEDAISAGYVPEKGPNAGTDKWGKQKKGGNPKYVTDPATMLVARATTIACRLEFPDVIRGMASAELADDDQPVHVEVHASEVVERPARPSAAAALAAATAPEPEPAPAPEPVAPQAPEPAPAPAAEVRTYVLPVSKAKLDMIKAAFEKHGLGGRAAAVREQRMRVLSVLLDRPITDPRELTADEGSLVINHLGPDSGAQVIAEILAEQADPGHLEDAAAVDEAAGYDPTTEDGWPMDGAEAAAEGA